MAVQAGLRTRHITTVAVIMQERNPIRFILCSLFDVTFTTSKTLKHNRNREGFCANVSSFLNESFLKNCSSAVVEDIYWLLVESQLCRCFELVRILTITQVVKYYYYYL